MKILVWKVGKYGWILFKPNSRIQQSMIHMDQMILSEPSIIIIWTYQERMDGMDEQDIGWRNGWC
jgi:hypothetical protein